MYRHIVTQFLALRCSMRTILVAAAILVPAMAIQPVPLLIRPAVLVSVAASQVAGQQAGVSFGQPLPRQHFMSQRDHLMRRDNGQVGSPLLRQSVPQQPSQTRAPQPQAASQQQFSSQPVQPAPQRFNNQLAGSPQVLPSQQFSNQQASFPQTQPSRQFNNQQTGSLQNQPGQQVSSLSGQPAPQKVNQLAGSPQTQPSQQISSQAGSLLRQPAQQLNNQQPSLSQAQPSRQQHNNQRAGSPQRQPVPQQHFSNQQAGTQHPQSAGHLQINNVTAQQFATGPARRHPLCGVIPDPGECRAAFPR